MYDDSEDLLGKWFAKNPEKRENIFLATKFGMHAIPTLPRDVINSTLEYRRSAIEKSLEHLGLPFVDLYYVHRLDKVTPIEKTMDALVDLKKVGKIKHIGLSECSVDSLRRAYAVHPIACVQVEYSKFCTEIELPARQVLEAARELKVGVVAYSQIQIPRRYPMRSKVGKVEFEFLLLSPPKNVNRAEIRHREDEDALSIPLVFRIFDISVIGPSVVECSACNIRLNRTRKALEIEGTVRWRTVVLAVQEEP